MTDSEKLPKDCTKLAQLYCSRLSRLPNNLKDMFGTVIDVLGKYNTTKQSSKTNDKHFQHRGLQSLPMTQPHHIHHYQNQPLHLLQLIPNIC